MKTKILIVEDHHIFRMGLCELINHQPDLTVCGEADNAEDAWRLMQQLRPDMVVIDISLKNSNGIGLIEKIAEYDKNVLMLVLSMHDEGLYAERAIMAGAKAYIMKQESSATVIQAIRTVLSGKLYLSAKQMNNMLGSLRGEAQPSRNTPIAVLTQRECEVFRYIGQGLSTKDIAEKLDLAPKTVGTYRERIKEKLNLKNANELITQAARWVADH